MDKVQTILDKVAVGFSLICALHCIILPIAMIAIPVLVAGPLGDEQFHQFMLIGVLPTSIIALTMGCWKHKNRNVLIPGFIGLFILTATAFLGHDLFGELGEKVVTVIGAAILSYGHIRNHRLCKDDCHT